VENPAPATPAPEDIVHAWWRDLTRADEPGKPSRRGELAELRRCKTLEEVYFAPAFQALYHRIAAGGWRDKPRLAAVAGVLSHVRAEPETPVFAQHLARAPQPGDGPPVSEQRFRRLVAYKTLPELFGPLIRVLHLVGDAAPVRNLARGIYGWNDKTRSDWNFRYYDQLLDQDKNP
jgi:CRISPR system Cascade subunit CasB